MPPVTSSIGTGSDRLSVTRDKAAPGSMRLVVNLADLKEWFRSAHIGKPFEYHRGYLAMDRVPGSRLGEEGRKELDRVADAVLDMADAGHVHLVQRRHGSGDYSYLAVISSGDGRRRMRESAS